MTKPPSNGPPMVPSAMTEAVMPWQRPRSPRRHQPADQREGAHGETARAEPLKGPEGDQRRHRLRGTGVRAP
ncbi:hypothetical protein [Streptomyces sp. NPDC008317]|uniref:hypothetical protein n=1 Tax=Streptomyces sp. NPDC008317 TaxID=3364827 RepID=UPI0036ED41E9